MALKDKFIVRLTAEQRQQLEGLAATGKRSAAVITRARILLKADADAEGWTDDRIAEALDASPATVARVRKKFVEGGVEPLDVSEEVRRLGVATNLLAYAGG